MRMSCYLAICHLSHGGKADIGSQADPPVKPVNSTSSYWCNSDLCTCRPRRFTRGSVSHLGKMAVPVNLPSRKLAKTKMIFEKILKLLLENSGAAA